MRVIAVEEHRATEAFLRVAHGLDVVPGDETETDLMRTVEKPPAMRARLTDLDARLREMDALGQDMAVRSVSLSTLPFWVIGLGVVRTCGWRSPLGRLAGW